MRILVVDDEREKKRQIAEVLRPFVENRTIVVEYAEDVLSAKRTMKKAGFDLLVLDINLPKRSDLPANPGDGLEVLRWLKGAGNAFRPTYIVGLTAFQESFELAASEFDNLIWTILHFEYTDGAWKDRLRKTVQTTLDTVRPPFKSDGRTYRTDLAIVTALREPELEAVLALPIDWTEEVVPHDPSRYFTAQLDIGSRKLRLVAAAASEKGLSGGAIAASKLAYSFRPKFLAMVGICAGIRGRVDLGDVVVADPSWDWGSGKIKKDASGTEIFHPAPYQMRIDETIRARAQILREDKAWRTQISEAFVGEHPDKPFEVRVGAVASGASVLQSSDAVRAVVDQHKDLLAIEMEIFSVMLSCHVAQGPRPRSLAIKAVCDFGDEGKNDTCQEYAAYTSAHSLLRLIPELFADEPE
jgi:nucleoside phosphorylase